MQNMKNRVIRVSDHTWDAAKAKADKEGTTVSKVVRNFLSAYVKAGAALVLAVLALAACSGSPEPATQPVAGRTAAAATSVAESTDEPSTAKAAAECWSAASPEFTDFIEAMNADTHYEAQIVLLRQLPDASEGCDAHDQETLSTLLAERDRIEAFLAG